MAEQEYVVNSSFLLKRGFAKDWEKLNPLLKQGEIGFILDQNAIKIGDGVTLWNALPIVGDDEFGKFESRIREELEKGWKKPVRFTKSIAIGSAEASGMGSFAAAEYKPWGVRDGCGYSDMDECNIRRLTEEEREYIYKYTGVYYEYLTPDDFCDYPRKHAIYFVDTDQLVHTTDFRYIYMYLEQKNDTEGCNVFNVADGETIDVNYTGPVVYLYPYEDEKRECNIRQLTTEEQNIALEKTGVVFQYIDLSNELPSAQNITISRPIGKTIHVIESKYINCESENGDELPRGDVFNITEGEIIDTPFIGYTREFIEGDYDDYQSMYIQKLTEAARKLIYEKYGKYYDYIEIYDNIDDDRAPIIELYDIERYGNVVSQSEYVESLGGRVFNLVDDTGFKAPYEGIMLCRFASADQGLDLENYEPTAIASGRVSFAQGYNVVASGYASHAEGGGSIASGDNSHAEGDGTTASGSDSHAEGYRTTASGNQSHAEGYYTTASGWQSHAEGKSTTALGSKSHAEGQSTTASGGGSHAEGTNTQATNSAAHAEGSNSIATGKYSHAEGQGTIARGEAQHAQGKYNIEDTEDKYAFIIGNGDPNSERSNAFTVDWNGDTKMAGWLDTQGLYGNTLTRNLYVGGAKDIDGNWQPKNPFIVDYAEKYSVKNQAYVSTMKVPKQGTYWLTAPKGSNYIYKIQIQYANGSTNTFNINSLPTSTAGQYGSYYEYNYAGFTAIFGDKTRVDSSSKSFPDGSTCYKRFNMQNGLKHYDDNLEQPYPAIKFYVDRAAAVKVWWVAGDANRPLTIQTEQNGGGASIDVSSEIRVHGTGHFYESLNVEGHVNVDEEVRADGAVYVGGDLEVDETARINNDLIVGGFISCGESLDMNGNDIKNAQTITVKGTSTLLGDVKVKNNANRDYTVKLRDVLDEALDYGFKSRVYVNEMDGATFTERLQNAINTVDDGGVVCIPYVEGLQYELDTRIDIPAKSVKLLGVGKERPIINFAYDEVHFAVDGCGTGFALERLVMNCKHAYPAVIKQYSDGDNAVDYNIVDCRFNNTYIFMYCDCDINGDVTILRSEIKGVNDYPNIVTEGLNNLTIIDSYLDGGNSSDSDAWGANIATGARSIRLENCHIVGYDYVLYPKSNVDSLIAHNCIVDVYGSPNMIQSDDADKIKSITFVGGNLGLQVKPNEDANFGKVVTQVELETALGSYITDVAALVGGDA